MAENKTKKDTESCEKASLEEQNQNESVSKDNENQENTSSKPDKEAEKSKKVADELQKKVKQLTDDLETSKDRHLRTLAEYDNYRKRTEREKAALYGDATAAAVNEILPVADNLERALAQEECSAEDLRKGVEMVNTQLQQALEKLGVKPMGEVGDEFNPDLHNAVSHIENEKLDENVISEVFQKGYIMGEKVVRHAMVQVAN